MACSFLLEQETVRHPHRRLHQQQYCNYVCFHTRTSRTGTTSYSSSRPLVHQYQRMVHFSTTCCTGRQSSATRTTHFLRFAKQAGDDDHEHDHHHAGDPPPGSGDEHEADPALSNVKNYNKNIQNLSRQDDVYQKQQEADRKIMNKLLLPQRMGQWINTLAILFILAGFCLNVVGYDFVVRDGRLGIDTMEARQFLNEVNRRPSRRSSWTPPPPQQEQER